MAGEDPVVIPKKQDRTLRETFLDFVCSHPWFVLALIVLASVLSLSQIIDFKTGKPILELDPSVDSILPKNDPDRAFFDHVKTTFDSGETILIALVDDDTIFKTENLDQIRSISEEIESLDQVSRISSLYASLNIRSEDNSLLIEPFYEEPPTNPEALEQLKQRALTDPIYSGNLISKSGKITVIMVHLLDLPERELLAVNIDGQVADIVHKYWQHGEVWITGTAHVKAAMSQVMLHDLATVVPLAVLIMGLVALASFRTIRGVVVPLFTVGISVLATMAFVSIFFDTLNQVTVVVPSLLVVVGFAYTIHVLSAYYDVIRKGQLQPGDSAARATMKEVSVPVIYTGITTSAGFLSLTTSPLSAIKQFGLGAGFGVLITMLVSLTFAPAILQLLSTPKSIGAKDKNTHLDRFLTRLAHIDIKYGKTILFIGAIVSILSLAALPHIQIGTDLVNSFKENSQIRKDFNAVNNNLEGANSFYVVLDTSVYEGFQEPINLKVIENLQDWLISQHEIGGTTSMVDYIKVINKGLYEGDAGFEIPDNRFQVSDLILLGGNDELENFVSFDYQTAKVVVRTTAMDSKELMALTSKVQSYLAENIPLHLSARVTGNSYLIAKTMDDIAIGQAVSIATAFIIIYLILVVLFTSFKAGAIALIPNAIPVLIYFGILGWTGISLNVTTGLVACIVLGIAVDDTIHLMSHFNRTAKETADETQGVVHALRTVGRPVTYTTIALCLGFLCMVTSDMRTQIEFGILAALTLTGAWVVDVTFTPAIAGKMKIVSLWDVLSLDLGDSPHKSIPLFAGLTPTQARIAALLANIQEYKQGKQIFTVGDTGDHMYVVIDGEVSVTLNNFDGTIFIEHLGRGQIIGEVALYHGERTANVHAGTDVRLLEITKDDLEDIQRRHPKIAAQLYANLNEVFAERIANLNTRIQT